jgi:hypothetical protein
VEDVCRDSVSVSELLPTVIVRLKDLRALAVICVQLFLLLWQSSSLMDVDEDASGYLEFIGEFKSLSNVIALIIALSRMRLLISYLIFNIFLTFTCFLPNVLEVLYCSFFLYICL